MKYLDLVRSLVAALNARDAATIRGFLEANATGEIPLETRVERMTELARRGAPFRLDGEPTLGAQEARFVLIDREGTRLDVAMDLTEQSPPKLKAMRIAPSRAHQPLGAWSDLPQLARLLVATRGVPAVGITLIRGGQRRSVAAGVRRVGSPETVGADEPWSIGSIGKPICTTVLARLIEKGKLRWDQTLGEALAGTPMHPGYASATLEQVMEHRGGIAQDLSFTRRRVEEIVGDARTPDAMRARYARDILQRPPIARPGERCAYSNAGYALLGHVAERTAGRPYEALLKELVFAPLGMKCSFTGVDPLPAARPSGHDLTPAGLAPANQSGALEHLTAPAGGGLFLSTADLARFGAEHLKGLRGRDGLLKATTVRRLHRGLPERAGDRSFLYGCGWGIEANPGLEAFHGHNGSNGTMRAQLAVFPRAGIVVAAITNCGGEDEPSPGLEAALAIGRKWAAG